MRIVAFTLQWGMMRLQTCRLAEHGLSTSGRKADLAARLQAHVAGAAADVPQGLPASSAAPAHGAGFAQGGLMPKGGKRKNFVRMNLKARRRAAPRWWTQSMSELWCVLDA